MEEKEVKKPIEGEKEEVKPGPKKVAKCIRCKLGGVVLDLKADDVNELKEMLAAVDKGAKEYVSKRKGGIKLIKVGI